MNPAFTPVGPAPVPDPSLANEPRPLPHESGPQPFCHALRHAMDRPAGKCSDQGKTGDRKSVGERKHETVTTKETHQTGRSHGGEHPKEVREPTERDRKRGEREPQPKAIDATLVCISLPTPPPAMQEPNLESPFPASSEPGGISASVSVEEAMSRGDPGTDRAPINTTNSGTLSRDLVQEVAPATSAATGGVKFPLPETREPKSALASRQTGKPIPAELKPQTPPEPPKKAENKGVSEDSAPVGNRPEQPGSAQETETVPPRGMAVAEEGPEMKMPPTAQAEVALTVNPVAVATDGRLRGGSQRRPEALRLEGSHPISGFLSSAPILSKDSGNLEVPSIPKVSPPTPARILGPILHEVALLRQTKGTSMAVVLKPDSATQLLVNLSYKEGRLEASVTCERGDFANLQSHWPELRRVLETQGVRLAELNRPAGSSADSQGNPGGFSRHDGRSRPDSNDFAPVPAIATGRSSQTTLHKTPAASRRLLESWA